MKRIDLLFWLVALSLPFTISAQNDTSSHGIKWTSGLSWEQVKQKAKQENKYIFLDCFTTWCGPCKRMDMDVYINDSVGNFFNNKFISIRVQMDQTKKDNEFIQSWYNDVGEIGRHYFINVYPTFLFFSPNAVLVNKEIGYKEPNAIMSIAQLALTPGRVYDDSYVEYKKLMDAYRHGEINYERLPFMVETAKILGDTISRELVRVHEKYVSELPKAQRYTKENITFWSSLNLTSDRKIVQFFYRDGKMIDRVMSKKGYAAKQVDKCIQNFVVTPFINEQLNPVAKLGVTTINAATGAMIHDKASYDEANWNKLYSLINREFNSYYAKRNVLKAKAIWYANNSNWISFAKASLKSFKKYTPDLSDWIESHNVNALGWQVFLTVDDKKLINESINWMDRLAIASATFFPKWNAQLDTYANLLYKLGKTDLAIQWERKAANLNPSDKSMQKALEQMQRGEPTYGVQPLTSKR